MQDTNTAEGRLAMAYFVRFVFFLFLVSSFATRVKGGAQSIQGLLRFLVLGDGAVFFSVRIKSVGSEGCRAWNLKILREG